jgi:hypothetical protein
MVRPGCNERTAPARLHPAAPANVPGVALRDVCVASRRMKAHHSTRSHRRIPLNTIGARRAPGTSSSPTRPTRTSRARSSRHSIRSPLSLRTGPGAPGPGIAYGWSEVSHQAPSNRSLNVARKPSRRHFLLRAVTTAGVCVGVPACSGGDVSVPPDTGGSTSSSSTSSQVNDCSPHPYCGTYSNSLDSQPPATSTGTTSGSTTSSSASTSETTDGDAGTCPTCDPGSVCVEDQTSGGALVLPDDAGDCPAGRVATDAGMTRICQVEPTFHCAMLPSACATAPGSTAIAHCTCAPSLCSGEGMCSDLSPTLVECLLLAP